jgi:hypothetical protein
VQRRIGIQFRLLKYWQMSAQGARRAFFGTCWSTTFANRYTGSQLQITLVKAQAHVEDSTDSRSHKVGQIHDWTDVDTVQPVIPQHSALAGPQRAGDMHSVGERIARYLRNLVSSSFRVACRSAGSLVLKMP